MKKLLKREFELTKIDQKLVKIYLILSVIFIFLAWILGPHVLGLWGAEQLNLYILIIIFLIMTEKISSSLKKDMEEGQSALLQTLPIKKEHIVHAKYMTVFFINIISLLWTAGLCILNIVINQGMWDDLTIVLIFSSMLLFVSSTIIGSFFLSRKDRLNIIHYLSLLIWLVLFLVVNYISSMYMAWIMSFIIFIGSWLVAMNRVAHRGINRVLR